MDHLSESTSRAHTDVFNLKRGENTAEFMNVCTLKIISISRGKIDKSNSWYTTPEEVTLKRSPLVWRCLLACLTHLFHKFMQNRFHTMHSPCPKKVFEQKIIISIYICCCCCFCFYSFKYIHVFYLILLVYIQFKFCIK